MPFLKQTRSKIEQLGVSEGMLVADFGSGSGFFTLALAEAVGKSGKVFAVDIFQDYLSKLKKEAENKSLENIVVIRADLEKGSKIKSDSLDAVVAADILFQINDKQSFIKEMHRVLKDNGRILLVDWSIEAEFVPNRELLIEKTDVIKLFENNNFIHIDEIKVAEHKYGLVFRKKA